METRSFRDLESDPNVTAEELRAVLEDYAASGASVDDRVVIVIIQRTDLTDSDRNALRASAQKGLDNQTRRQETKSADEYRRVVHFLS